MSRNTMSFALPESMRDYIDARVRDGSYGNTSEYLRELIRRDQHEQAAQALSLTLALEVVQQLIATAGCAVVGVHHETGELGGSFVRILVASGARDDHAVALDDREPIDVVLEHLARAPDENALLLEWLDQREDPTDVALLRHTDALERLRGDHRADAGAAGVAGVGVPGGCAAPMKSTSVAPLAIIAPSRT